MLAKQCYFLPLFKALFSPVENADADAVSSFVGSLGPCYDRLQPIGTLLQTRRNGTQLEEQLHCLPYPIAESALATKGKACGLDEVFPHLFSNSSTSRKLPTWFISQPVLERKHGGVNSFLHESGPGCRSTCQGIAVIDKSNMFPHQVATQPAWLFFHSASTACYKDILDHAWYFRRNCSRKAVYKFAQSVR